MRFSCKGEPSTVQYASSSHAERVVSGVSDGPRLGGMHGIAIHMRPSQRETGRCGCDLVMFRRHRGKSGGGGEQAHAVDRSPASRVSDLTDGVASHGCLDKWLGT